MDAGRRARAWVRPRSERAACEASGRAAERVELVWKGLWNSTSCGPHHARPSGRPPPATAGAAQPLPDAPVQPQCMRHSAAVSVHTSVYRPPPQRRCVGQAALGSSPAWGTVAGRRPARLREAPQSAHCGGCCVQLSRLHDNAFIGGALHSMAARSGLMQCGRGVCKAWASSSEGEGGAWVMAGSRGLGESDERTYL